MKPAGIYLRSIIFGTNDSLVSTVGFLAGISVAGVPRSTVVITGIVYALVEGFSMAAGEFLSEESGEEYERRANVSDRSPLIAGSLMFVASVATAMIPLAPYLLFVGTTALVVSAGASILGLFIVGAMSARLSRLPMAWRGLRMALLGGFAILIGVVVGRFFFPAA